MVDVNGGALCALQIVTVCAMQFSRAVHNLIASAAAAEDVPFCSFHNSHLDRTEKESRGRAWLNLTDSRTGGQRSRLWTDCILFTVVAHSDDSSSSITTTIHQLERERGWIRQAAEANEEASAAAIRYQRQLPGTTSPGDINLFRPSGCLARRGGAVVIEWHTNMSK